MRGFQWLFLSAIFCVQLRYSFQQVAQIFGVCTDDTECPDYSTCVAVASTGNACQCEEGYDAIDAQVTSDGQSVTECRDLGECSPYDNIETDCGKYGRCVAYTDSYGVFRAACKCEPGYSGINCDKPVTILPPIFPTTRRPYVTTRRPGGNFGAIIPAIGGGILLLALFAGGAAALASSTG